MTTAGGSSPALPFPTGPSIWEATAGTEPVTRRQGRVAERPTRKRTVTGCGCSLVRWFDSDADDPAKSFAGCHHVSVHGTASGVDVADSYRFHDRRVLFEGGPDIVRVPEHSVSPQA